MFNKIKRFVLIGSFFSSTLSFASLPDIFKFEDETKATGIHVTLRGQDKDGAAWVTRNVAAGDFDILASLYQNPVVMANFGDGSLRTPEQINGRIKLWTERSQKGQPHGGLIIQDADGQKPIGVMVAGVGEGVGVSEVARMILPEYQSKGMGTSAMRALVQSWAPAVCQLGLQEDNLVMRENFRCFGGSELKMLYVSSAPVNVGSWISQVRAGFEPKPVSVELPIINFVDREFENYEEMELAFAEFFDPAKTDAPLTVGTLYAMTDHQGLERTISMHPDYKKPRFHFIYDMTK